MRQMIYTQMIMYNKNYFMIIIFQIIILLKIYLILTDKIILLIVMIYLNSFIKKILYKKFMKKYIINFNIF